jgi:preprotein translocase subunit SecB
MGDLTAKAEKASAGKSGFAGAEYNLVAMGAELQRICVANSRFEIIPAHFAHQDEWKLSYGRRVKSCSYDAAEHYAMVIFEYHVTAKRGRSKAMQCVADYVVIYSVPDNATEAAALGFSRNVGAFAAYPYFRALSAHLFAEAGLNIPPLPAIASTAHIPPKQKAKELPGATA